MPQFYVDTAGWLASAGTPINVDLRYFSHVWTTACSTALQCPSRKVIANASCGVTFADVTQPLPKDWSNRSPSEYRVQYRSLSVVFTLSFNSCLQRRAVSALQIKNFYDGSLPGDLLTSDRPI